MKTHQLHNFIGVSFGNEQVPDMLEVRLDDFYGSPAVMLAVSSNNGHDEATVWLSIEEVKNLRDFLSKVVREVRPATGQRYSQLTMNFGDNK